MGVEVAIAMMAVGTAVSAYGQYQAGRAQKAARDYNARLAEQNAKIAQDKAAYEADRQEARVRAVMAKQRVGGRGITRAGTPLEMLRQTAMEGELDRLSIMYGGDIEAVNERAKAAAERMQGKAAYQAGVIGSTGTLLSGAGKAGYAYAKADKLGMFDPG